MHALLICLLLAGAPEPPNPWRTLAAGLEWAAFEPGLTAPTGDGRIHVLRIDPADWEFRLLAAADDPEQRSRTARDWCTDRGLTAAINAGMYQEDGLTPVSLLRDGNRIYNPRVSKDRSMFVFGSSVDSLPPARIVDRDCEDWESATAPYRTLMQSIRMVSCTGRNVWAPGPRAFSTAAIGTDRWGRVLFIHASSPYPTHDLINALLALPLELDRCLYGEGGGESQLFVSTAEFTRDHVGLTAGGLLGGEGQARPIPNVIGIVARNAVSEDP